MIEQSAASHGSKDVYKYGYVDVSTPGSPGSTTAGPNHTQKKSLILVQKER